ncbi:MAG: hypothetical protein IJ268_09955 [Proteobacteria bacterium]|nr:hypothetical protein [Pseudomonadota bacterium]
MFTSKDFYKEPFYYGKPDKEVHSMKDWEYEFEPKKNLKIGRSAHCLAKFMMEQDGLAKILERLKGDLYDEDVSEGFGEFYNNMLKYVHIDKCIIEKPDPFDVYPNPRKHDLAIYGRMKGRKFKILVEAKVDESFGPTVEEAYQASLDNPHSQLHYMIDELLDQYSQDEIQWEYLKKCRYQLLHDLVAANNGKDYEGSDEYYNLTVMLVLVFKTNLYDSSKGRDNLMVVGNFIHFSETYVVSDLFKNDKENKIQYIKLQLRGNCYLKKNELVSMDMNLIVDKPDGGIRSYREGNLKAQYWVIES